MRFRVTGNVRAIVRIGGIFRKEYRATIDETIHSADLSRPFKRTISTPKIPASIVVEIDWATQSATVSVAIFGFEIYRESARVDPKILEFTLVKGEKEISKGVFLKDIKITIL